MKQKQKSRDRPEFMRAQLYTVPVSLRPSEIFAPLRSVQSGCPQDILHPRRTADRQCSIHGALPIQWELRFPCAVCDGYPLANLRLRAARKASVCSEMQVKSEYSNP